MKVIEKNWGNQCEQEGRKPESPNHSEKISERRFKEERFYDLQDTAKIAIMI